MSSGNALILSYTELYQEFISWGGDVYIHTYSDRTMFSFTLKMNGMCSYCDNLYLIMQKTELRFVHNLKEIGIRLKKIDIK